MVKIAARGNQLANSEPARYSIPPWEASFYPTKTAASVANDLPEKEAQLTSSAYYYIIYAGIMAASGLVAFVCDRALKKISQKKSVS